MANQTLTLTHNQRTLLAWTLIVGLLFALLYLLGNVVTPFAVAAVLAYALDPMVSWVMRKSRYRLRRTAAAAIVVLIAILCVAGLVMLIVPIVLEDVPKIRGKIPAMLDQVNDFISPWLAKFGLPFQLEIDSLKTWIAGYLTANPEASAGKVGSAVSMGGAMLLKVLGNLLLIPLVLFYFLVDWQRILEAIIELVPLKWRQPFIAFVLDSDEVLGQYLRGQLSVMLVMAVFYTVGLALFSLKLALPIGLFTGIAMFIPYVGFGLGLVLAFVAGVLQFGALKAALMVALVYGAGQVVESFYLTPRWVGERIGLHPVTVIFALMAFGQLFGFVGMLVALPVSAILFVAMRRIKARYFESALFTGKKPKM